MFVRSGTTWALQAYLKAPNADGYDGGDGLVMGHDKEMGDLFGVTVDISGDTIVVTADGEDGTQAGVGSFQDSDNGPADNATQDAGAVYVFGRSGVTWTAQAYVKPPSDKTWAHFSKHDYWLQGARLHVSIDGDTLAVSWPLDNSLATTITNGATGYHTDDNTNPPAQSAQCCVGATYVYVRSTAGWNLQAFIKAPNAEYTDWFGAYGHISGDTLAVSAPSESSSDGTLINGPSASNDNESHIAGAVYVFVRTGTTWASQAYLKAPDVASLLPHGPPMWALTLSPLATRLIATRL